MRSGSSAGKYILLLAFLALLGGWMYWRQSYGTIGRVAQLSSSTADYIAFVRTEPDGACNLFVVRSDGTDMKPLTGDDAPKRAPTWSPDGRRISYVKETRSEGTSAFQLFVLGEGAPRQATYGSFSKDMPQWRPDGKQIAYLAGGAIKVVNPNGSETEQIYPRPHKGNSPGGEGDGGANPLEGADGLKRPPITWYRWSPTGTSLAGIQVMEGENAPAPGVGNWWSGRSGAADETDGVAVVEPESIVVLPHLQAEPNVLPGANKVRFGWYPDGRRVLVALSTRQGRHALLRFRTDEKNLPVEPLVTAAAYTIAPENPVVSPDGKTVAFELWRMESSENRTQLGIAVIPAETEEPIIVAKTADQARLPLIVKGDARYPSWSPDGTRILYTRLTPTGGADVCVAKADGTGEVNLTKGKGDNIDAVWSPARR